MSQTVNASPRIAPFTATGSAPCKINLTLDVFAPRPDGFHDLSSIVVPMAYPADTVTVSVKHGSPDAATQLTLTCDDSTLPTDDKNIAFRAARDFARAFLPVHGLALHVDLIKRLPHQAGLGGGSSDAATVLRLLCQHIPQCVVGNEHLLVPLAAGLGSDVPLFLHNGPVWMRGRGDTIAALRSPIPPIFGVLLKPSVGVPTGPAYALLDASPERQELGSKFIVTATAFLSDALHKKRVHSAAELGPLLHNDFEAVVLPAFPEVARAHQAVQEVGAVRALLCGSGSAIFGLAQNKEHAQKMSSALKEHWPYVAETSTLNESEPNEAMEPCVNG